MNRIYFFTIIILLFYNCSNNDNSLNSEPIVLTDNIEAYNEDLIDDSLVLAVENGGNKAYLLNKLGEKTFEWFFDTRLGNDLELLPDGRLIGIFKINEPDIGFGGYGGILKILDSNSSVEWQYTYASSDYIAHHEVEMLPNGNILFLAWERLSAFEAQELGINTIVDIYPEALIEMETQSNQIVWKWNSIDHIIQDQFSTLPNYGNVSENPQLIDINYNLEENGDIMHANGIDFDEERDVIFLSINGYNEIWAIDHSTSLTEVATNSGGNYDKGGNLLYRFGNPEAYQNTNGLRLFYNNHFPNLLENGVPGNGNMLVFVNKYNNMQQSVVYELKIPELLSLNADINNEPQIVWEFTHPDLFYKIVSGAVRLNNGNTLICEGDYGFWEVTNEKEVVWKYNSKIQSSYWRGYNYNYDSDAIKNLGL